MIDLKNNSYGLIHMPIKLFKLKKNAIAMNILMKLFCYLYCLSFQGSIHDEAEGAVRFYDTT